MTGSSKNDSTVSEKYLQSQGGGEGCGWGGVDKNRQTAVIFAHLIS